MAGGKKKKKPVSNPARGFATTSVASKPKAEVSAAEDLSTTPKELLEVIDAPQGLAKHTVEGAGSSQRILTPEEFERQLEESDLQVLVEKHAQKSKRDALRQKIRLETDRRVLRSQADGLNTRKWLPSGLMEQILDLIKTEGRFSGPLPDSASVSKQSSEEELTVRLWILHQSLVEAGFQEVKVQLALNYVLNNADHVGVGNKDAIWGMEESLDWLARECSRDELPDYDNWQRKGGTLPKSQIG